MTDFNEIQFDEWITEGSKSFSELGLSELFSKEGRHVYVYHLRGYEHSDYYISYRKIEESDIKKLVDECNSDFRRAMEFDREWDNQPRIRKLYDENNYEAICEIQMRENYWSQRSVIRGDDLPKRLFMKFGMIRLASDAEVFVD